MLLAGLQALTLLLLVAYLGWGIYTLDLRYRRHEDSSPAVETITLLLVLVFYAIELSLLRQTMRDESVIYMFAVLGLFVSGAALYGHMAVSLTSRLLVDVITPDSHQDPNQPRLGPAEALERQHDFEGAIQEYLVLARIFPRNALIPRRLGENYLAMKEPQEALPWFQRAFERTDNDEDDALMVANRWIETAQKGLSDTAEAERACLAYLRRFPKGAHAASLRERLEKILRTDGSPPGYVGLELLEALGESATEAEKPDLRIAEEARHNAPLLGLDRLEETGVSLAPVEEPEAPPTKLRAKALGLEALSAIDPAPSPPEDRDSSAPAANARKGKKNLGLDALNEKPIEER